MSIKPKIFQGGLFTFDVNIPAMINTKLKTSSLFDFRHLKNVTMYDRSLMLEFVQLYVKQLPAYVYELKKGHESGDAEVFQKKVEKLKTSVLLIKSDEIMQMIGRLESSNSDQKSIYQLIMNIESSCNELCKELELVLSEY